MPDAGGSQTGETRIIRKIKCGVKSGMYENQDYRIDVANKIKMILTGRGQFYKNKKIGSMACIFLE